MSGTTIHGLGCTRLLRHTGRHAAGDGDSILAVWADPASRCIDALRADATDLANTTGATE